MTDDLFTWIQRTTTRDVCEFLGHRHPFRRLSHGQFVDLPDDFEVVILKRACEKCRIVLELLSDYSWNELWEHEWLAAYREPKQKWLVATVVRADGSEPDGFVITPTSLRTERGHVVGCQPVDERWIEFNQNRSDLSAAYRQFGDLPEVHEIELQWNESELFR
ncbi:MAG TPA: hypothetical protein PKD54_02165 [Pirellulaceae bacterium]|nr:hypothetical protein [Pirellulaceae bacterium]